ncbi:MAG: hypothetical protein R3284_05255 [Rubricoccaceae bacterium]|nr:hypothetical protein [Rubricoccaceae bacterium]
MLTQEREPSGRMVEIGNVVPRFGFVARVTRLIVERAAVRVVVRVAGIAVVWKAEERLAEMTGLSFEPPNL